MYTSSAAMKVKTKRNNILQIKASVEPWWSIHKKEVKPLGSDKKREAGPHNFNNTPTPLILSNNLSDGLTNK